MESFMTEHSLTITLYRDLKAIIQVKLINQQ